MIENTLDRFQPLLQLQLAAALVHRGLADKATSIIEVLNKSDIKDCVVVNASICSNSLVAFSRKLVLFHLITLLEASATL